MTTLITGAHGQLGSDLRQMITGSCTAVGRTQLDITSAEQVDNFLQEHRPTVVINAAAYNSVDQAEDEPDVAYAVNALGPRNLAVACQRLGATLVHVSTDYVFGQDTSRLMPFSELDPPAPCSAYGISKLAGEHFVQSCCRRSFVVRTCGVYGHAARDGAGKGNFVETMLRLGSELDQLKVVNDQYCTPTASLDLADGILRLLQTTEYGLYHFSSDGSATWYDFALEIFSIAGIDVDLLPIPSSEYPTRAVRPRFSLLDCTRYETATGELIPNWQSALRRYLQQREQQLSEQQQVAGTA
ncbi:MAG: dTDP-4-dehydrorhamnose reductase [Planctomycetaceae bacterium]|nr:dTDP-4-dehydrorhamnose reductase [Planctomycetaceae bacterium]